MTQALDIPAFFDPKNARNFNYVPDHIKVAEAAFAARSSFGVRPSASAAVHIALLGIDLQKSFTHPEGTLYVAGRSGTGAIDDNVRFSEFGYRNAGVITDIDMTMDTHTAFQIFFATFWQTASGEPLGEHTMIKLDKQRRLINVALDGTVLHVDVQPRPELASWICKGNYPWLLEQVKHYCAELEKAGKYTLYLWPPHCLMGSAGHALAGVIDEMRYYHTILRGGMGHLEVKGGNPLTENYSVFAPEVLSRHDGQGALASRNATLLAKLIRNDALIVGGQASSHCVLSSLDDAITEVVKVDPALARKIYVLEDCMSPVVVPGADFTPQAEAGLDRWRKQGCHVVRSTDDIASWPGMKQLLGT